MTERASCIVCGKEGRRKMHGARLCGECWKEWQASGEVKRAAMGASSFVTHDNSSFHRRAFEDFVRRVTAERRVAASTSEGT